jgi:acetyl esterase
MLSEKLDPGVRAFLQLIASMETPPLDSYEPTEARLVAAEHMKPAAGAPEDVAFVEDLTVDGPSGPFLVRRYRAASVTAPAAAVVFFHGGGWVIGSVETYDVLCRALANRTGAMIFSVDYRLAPEHKFPDAVDDCVAATEWVFAHAGRLGVDPNRVSVMGDSAGGNLAAVVTHKLRASKFKIASQVLVYPVTDLASMDTVSYQEFAEDHQLTKSLMMWFKYHYLRSEDDARNPEASPLLATDFRNLPPALVITAECDPLRDEGEIYAARLASSAVSVTLTRYPGMIHPFFSLGGVIPQATAAIEQIAEFLRGAKAQAA